MCEFFFWCDYCLLLTINMLCHVEVTLYPVVKRIKKLLCPDDEHIVLETCRGIF